MVVAWIEPKTNWTESDYFNPSDYNRIIGNIKHLQSMAKEFYKNISSAQLGEEKTYQSLIYAREMNDIENAIESINNQTYGLNIGEKKEYFPNKSTPLWSEFNRIENAIFTIYKTINSQKDAIARLAFTLGGQKGFKV